MKSIISNQVNISLSNGKDIYFRLENGKSDLKYNHYKARMRGERITKRQIITKRLFEQEKNRLVVLKNLLTI